MIKHHPSHEQLALFTAGSMPTHYAAAISTHLEFCEQCKTNAKKLENIGGVSFEKITAVNVSDSLKTKLFEKLDGKTNNNPHTESIKGLNKNHSNTIPKVLHKILANGLDKAKWKWTGPGIHAAKLESFPNGTQLSLLKIQPGKAIATHTHKCDEVTVLFKGSLSDEFGIYQKGDYVLMDQNHRHRPVASNDEECICLTVIESPLQFSGYFMGLLNPVISRYLS
jgi:putative transcriptional regulator